MNWGSVADWVSGLGTLAAVLFALFLYQREKRDKRYKYADNFVTRREIRPPLHDEDTRSVFISLVNTGTAPIPFAFVIGAEDVAGNVHLQLFSFVPSPSGRNAFGSSGTWQPTVPPGARVVATFTYPRDVEIGEYLVVMQDAAGASWYREVVANRFISGKQAIRDYPALSDPSVAINGTMV